MAMIASAFRIEDQALDSARYVDGLFDPSQRGRRLGLIERALIEALPRPIDAPGDLDPLGGEALVNTTTAEGQFTPNAAALDGGGFVVTWHSANQDGAEDGVYARRFDANGAPIGGEIHVNTTMAANGAIGIPFVTALDGGGFVVTWTYGATFPNFDVLGQRYNASGAAVGGEFTVNSTTANTQQTSTSTALEGGGFVVTWHSTGQDPGDGTTNTGVYAQIFSDTASPIGGEFHVNSTTLNRQEFSSVAGLEDGGFVVVWHSGTSSAFDVYGQRYNAAGAEVGGEFLINTTTTGFEANAGVAALDDGGFVVVWSASGQDGSGSGVYAQRYNAAGAKAGGEFRVNTTTVNEQNSASVAGLEGGGFIVTWNSRAQDVPGESFNNGVYAQVYDASGNALGGEVLINETTIGSQTSTIKRAVTQLNDGTILVSWEGPGVGDTYGVFVRRFAIEGSGPVTIPGTGGDDILVGTGADEVLLGKAGNDTLQGRGGGDTLNGGAGSDWADYANAAAKVRADLESPGANTGDAAGDSYVGIENLRGGAKGDSLLGDDLANRILGLGKDDVLTGRGGKDTLAGGKGADTLEGGGGGDRFDLASIDPDDADTIDDFAGGSDTIALDSDVFGLPEGALAAGRFVVGGTAQDGNDRIIYKAAQGKLYFDPDGTGAQAQVLIATLTDAPTLGAADFVVI